MVNFYMAPPMVGGNNVNKGEMEIRLYLCLVKFIFSYKISTSELCKYMYIHKIKIKKAIFEN